MVKCPHLHWLWKCDLWHNTLCHKELPLQRPQHSPPTRSLESSLILILQVFPAISQVPQTIPVLLQLPLAPPVPDQVGNLISRICLLHHGLSITKIAPWPPPICYTCHSPLLILFLPVSLPTNPIGSPVPHTISVLFGLCSYFSYILIS